MKQTISTSPSAVSLSTHIRRRLFFLLCSLLAVACGATTQSQCAEPSATGSPLLSEATTEFTTMTTTLYQHQTQVDRAAGSYRYDCVGFVSYALKRAMPQAWDSVVKATGLAKGRIPSPPRYRAFFASLSEKPQAGWETVTKASELRPGDVVAWEHETDTAVGHAVIIASTPLSKPGGVWLVEVYDSTSSPHRDDSRPGDSRAQAMASNGRRSGLGHGVMALIADSSSGVLTGYRWSPKGKTITTPIAAARPTS